MPIFEPLFQAPISRPCFVDIVEDEDHTRAVNMLYSASEEAREGDAVPLSALAS